MLKNLNYKLIVIVIALLIIGEVAVYSASSVRHDALNMVAKQGLWLSIGICVITVIMIAGYRRIIETAYLMYVLTVIMLVLVMLVGARHLGAQRWLSLGFLNIQPSELAKFVFVVALARFFGFEKQRVNRVPSLMWAVVMLAFIFVLVLKQPDLGTALTFVPIFAVILFVAGLNLKYFIGFFVSGLLTMPFLWNILKDYQKKRLMVFLNPNLDPLGAGYTIIQSKIAIGSGGLFGKGYLMGTQSQFKFLPEAHTDFIFAVISEEWGFAGVLAVILLYFGLIMEGFNITHRSKSVYGRLLSAGITTMLAFHFLINVSMTIGLVPVVGLPLPFISYGGSNLIISLAGVGLLLAIDKENKSLIF